MTISNHILTGSMIALTIRQPALALPLAFMSHFALDAVPHYGYGRGGYAEIFKHRLAYLVVILDIVGVMLLISTVVFIGWITFAAALLAILPDIAWPYRYFYYERKGIAAAAYRFTHFHERIQWSERPWGILIEIPFFIVGFILISRLVAV